MKMNTTSVVSHVFNAHAMLWGTIDGIKGGVFGPGSNDVTITSYLLQVGADCWHVVSVRSDDANIFLLLV